MINEYAFFVRVEADDHGQLMIELASVLKAQTKRHSELLELGYEPVSIGTYRTLWRERDTLHCTVSTPLVLPEILEVEVGK